ncbi:MAG: propionyl-CoA carboxylase, partial [Proteobacteria bacterium]|nr:propionyl-CoA carboxylase [Pseudomonadota bacterium]
MGGPENVARQHSGGRLTVRERIERITDEGSLREVGTLAGTGEYGEHHVLRKVTPAPYVAGLARIDGRPVAIGGEDFTVRGGTSFGALRRKGGQGGYIEDLAHHYKIPLVNLIDGAGGTVTSAKRRGYVVFPGVDGFERSVELLGEVPVISAVLGTAAGGPAGRAILSHFSVMVRGTSQIFAAGPPVVKRSLGQVIDKEELGGAAVAVDEAGSVHKAVESEDDAFDQIRRFLSFMPQNVWELPPVLPVTDPVERREEALLDIVPESRTR